MMAVKYALILKGAIFRMICQELFYIDLSDLMDEVHCQSFSQRTPRNPRPQVLYLTKMGQLIDLITAPEDKVDLSKILTGTGQLCSTRLLLTPTTQLLLRCSSAAFLSRRRESRIRTTTSSRSTILLPLGEYAQIEGDYLDFSAEGRASWSASVRGACEWS